MIAKGTPGLRQGKKESKLGIRASHTAEVVLEDCRIPVENLLGGMEKLERKLERARSGQSSGRSSGALATFELTRPVVGASALGIAQAAYSGRSPTSTTAWIDPVEAVLDESSTAGNPPLERQSVQQVLADVATEIDASRLLVSASWMGRAGIPLTGGQGSMSKLKAGDVAMWATRTLMDLVGPHAWSKKAPLEKWFRDAKIYQLFEERRRSSAASSPRCRSRSTAGDSPRAPRSRRTPSAAPRRPCRRTATGAQRRAPARAAQTGASDNGDGCRGGVKTTA